jgi:hypothetical protein
VKDLYTKKHKTLMKEIEHINKWEDIPHSRTKKFNVKIPYCLKQPINSMKSPLKS